ncbi:MAG: hypothetical protein ACYC2E_12265 [Sulfuricella sp.]
MTAAAQLDPLCINTLRTLSIDAVQQAQSVNKWRATLRRSETGLPGVSLPEFLQLRWDQKLRQ